jgi:hypothetical protein
MESDKGSKTAILRKSDYENGLQEILDDKTHQ